MEIAKDRSVTLKLGNDSLEIKVGKRSVTAMQAIELSVGPSKFKMDPSGITLEGIKIEVKGTAMTNVSAPMTDIKGQAILSLGGGLTKIG